MSDCEVEEQGNDRLSFLRFVGIPLDSMVPDNSVISRFRTALTQAGAYEELLNEFNRQLEQHQILVRTGVIVDASITDTPAKQNLQCFDCIKRQNYSTKWSRLRTR